MALDPFLGTREQKPGMSPGVVCRHEEHASLTIPFSVVHRASHFCIKNINILVYLFHSHNKVEKTPSCSSF